MPYNFTAIEKKWQAYWLEHKVFAALEPAEAGGMPKSYILDMFPYPSGAGLHVGHPEGYTATDIVSRYQRMRGFNVLHPMGWDAFGLPAEQYAIKTGTHPRETTRQNIANFRRQIQMLGLSYDWDREVDTTDPAYFKWTQWIFLQLYNSYFDPFENKARPIAHLMEQLVKEALVVAPDGSVHINATMDGLEEIAGEVRIERLWREIPLDEQREVIDNQRLAYMDEVPVNWCPGLGTVLSNEEVVDGKSEVGGFPVERRPMRQWMLRITAYGDRLLDDLNLLDWPESLKEMQRNWIGKSVGAEVDFDLDPPPAGDASSPAASSAASSGEARVVVGAPTPQPTPSSQDDDEPPPDAITVFTTRPDTLHGATYMVLAPEHPLVNVITVAAQQAAVAAYCAASAARSDRDRIAQSKDKSGVPTGAFAVNPVNGQRIPVFVADYVLMGYGTGAIMAVPAHDERDFEFAGKFSLPIRAVVMPDDAWLIEHRPAGNSASIEALRELYIAGPDRFTAAFTGEGVAINSGALDGLPTAQAKQRIIDWLEDQGMGHRTVKYKLRDWLFARQRYWGEPFPILLDDQNRAYALSEADLPVTLPDMADFQPTGTPEGPLSKATDWLTVKTDDGVFHRESNTMPQWAGSCWYYLRYIDPHNAERFVDPEKERYWMPVDLYVGGAEHAVLHLLYARFWHKVLYDLGHVSTPEPFKRLINQGIILGETEYTVFQTASGEAVSITQVRDIQEQTDDDHQLQISAVGVGGEKLVGRRISEAEVERKNDGYVLKSNPAIRVDARSSKMSKSRGNVVNPDDIVGDYGADTFRLYEMYMGPLEAPKPWNTRDIVGMSRFLNSVWRNLIGDDEALQQPVPPPASPPARETAARAVGVALQDRAPEPNHVAHQTRSGDVPVPEALDRQMHRAIKKVGQDIEALRFNTAIAELIKLNNELTGVNPVPRELAETLTLLLAPFAPHVAEEIWQRLGHHKSLARRPWPSYDPAKLVESSIELPVQVNGKLRDKITVPAEFDEDQVVAVAQSAERVKPWLSGKTLVKRLYVPGKLVNFVVK